MAHIMSHMGNAWINSAVGAELRAARARRDWSRDELSTRSGVPTATLRRYEEGVRSVPVDTLVRLIAALDMDVADIERAIQKAMSSHESESMTTAAELDAATTDVAIRELEVDGVDDQRHETG